MQIKVKLMAALRSKLPADAVKGTAAMEVEEGTTIAGLLERLGISSGQVHLVMVNDDMETDRNRAVGEGDLITVFPPVAGGAC